MTYPTRLPKYPIPLNALGEMICPGCGRHFWPRWKDHRRVSVYHAEHCRDRVQRRGGRLTREQLRLRLLAFGVEFRWQRYSRQSGPDGDCTEALGLEPRDPPTQE